MLFIRVSAGPASLSLADLSAERKRYIFDFYVTSKSHLDGYTTSHVRERYGGSPC